ncbi:MULTISPECIES: hypothetical protein [Streptomyces]|uniref:Resolvase/invertase-type recombinase catalytic domain-containing protein n=1 Tax=Streptomyces siderophoricus TaxID=2802281 RepID=A0ABS1MTR0_9ACTN|nr:hypothetical protein [Streptomyces sp. 9-7]MBL1091143.1 hypothetical protein [Streptomyces sp. 9-7]
MSAVAPLAFVYDRCASRGLRARSQLEMRMTGCHAYADGRGWALAGGRWIDRGSDALSTQRPCLSALVDAMRAEAGRREVLCLVHNWGRLAADATHRLMFQRRIVEAGGWTCTTFGETDRRARAALAVGSAGAGR